MHQHFTVSVFIKPCVIENSIALSTVKKNRCNYSERINQEQLSTKFVSYKDIKKLISDLKTVYQTISEEEALNNLIKSKETWPIPPALKDVKKIGTFKMSKLGSVQTVDKPVILMFYGILALQRQIIRHLVLKALYQADLKPDICLRWPFRLSNNPLKQASSRVKNYY